MKYSLVINSDNNSSDDSKEELVALKDIKNYFERNENIKIYLISECDDISPSSKSTFLYFIPFLSDSQKEYLEYPKATLAFKSYNGVSSVLSESKLNISTLPGDVVNPESVEITNIYNYLPKNKNFTLLPNCIICLKRLEKSVSGLDSISCKDLYHHCCSKTCEMFSSGCKVCNILKSNECMCIQCGGIDNLWVCLICGNLGCGRYKGGHAHDHFLSTNHSFAMKLDSHHIWDYHFDRYVHWNIKSSEGTVVEVTDHLSLRMDSSLNASSLNDQAIQTPNEFINNFTTAQLESQQAFFESHIATIRKNFEESIKTLKENHTEEVEKCKIKISENENEHKILSNLITQFQANAKNHKTVLDHLNRELEAEKRISQGLTSKVDSLQRELDEAKNSNLELEDQVKDLLKHLEVLDLVEKAGNDPNIVGGKVLMRPAPIYNKKKSK